MLPHKYSNLVSRQNVRVMEHRSMNSNSVWCDITVFIALSLKLNKNSMLVRHTHVTIDSHVSRSAFASIVVHSISTVGIILARVVHAVVYVYNVNIIVFRRKTCWFSKCFSYRHKLYIREKLNTLSHILYRWRMHIQTSLYNVTT